jgi:hypothetical protein
MKNKHRAGRINTPTVGENQSQVRFLSPDEHLPKGCLRWSPEKRHLVAKMTEGTVEMMVKLGRDMADRERKLAKISAALFGDADFLQSRNSAAVFAIAHELALKVEGLKMFENVCVNQPSN